MEKKTLWYLSFRVVAHIFMRTNTQKPKRYRTYDTACVMCRLKEDRECSPCEDLSSRRHQNCEEQGGTPIESSAEEETTELTK